MTKFHVSPRDGVARRCNAGSGPNARGCRYGLGEQEHYATKAEASQAAEQYNKKTNGGTFNKKNKVKKPLSKVEKYLDKGGRTEEIFRNFELNDNFSGYGYILERRLMSDKDRAIADDLVLKNASTISDEELFKWANSKNGRWFANEITSGKISKARNLLPVDYSDDNLFDYVDKKKSENTDYIIFQDNPFGLKSLSVEKVDYDYGVVSLEYEDGDIREVNSSYNYGDFDVDDAIIEYLYYDPYNYY